MGEVARHSNLHRSIARANSMSEEALKRYSIVPQDMLESLDNVNMPSDSRHLEATSLDPSFRNASHPGTTPVSHGRD